MEYISVKLFEQITDTILEKLKMRSLAKQLLFRQLTSVTELLLVNVTV